MIARLVLFTVVWLALTADLTLANLVLGLAVGALVLWVTGVPAGSRPFRLRCLWAALSLAAFFLYELVVSSLRVAALVLRPRLELRPAILAVPIGLERDWQITLLANLITLTPGTLTVEVDDERGCLYVHIVDVDDADAARRDIQEGFEARIRRLDPDHGRLGAGGAA